MKACSLVLVPVTISWLLVNLLGKVFTFFAVLCFAALRNKNLFYWVWCIILESLGMCSWSKFDTCVFCSFFSLTMTTCCLILVSVTSSSVLVNLPAAAFLIITVRYFSLDIDMRRKAAAYNSKPSSANIYSQTKHQDGPKLFIKKSDWRRKVNSLVVEDAIDQFTRHLVSEWVTDLWYSRITPDKQGPEELVQIINGVLGEISCRMRNINLIDLLTRF